MRSKTKPPALVPRTSEPNSNTGTTSSRYGSIPSSSAGGGPRDPDTCTRPGSQTTLSPPTEPRLARHVHQAMLCPGTFKKTCKYSHVKRRKTMPDPKHVKFGSPVTLNRPTHTAKRTDRCMPTLKNVLQSAGAIEHHSKFLVQLANFAKQPPQLTRNAPQNNHMNDPPNQPDEPATCNSDERERANIICLVTQRSVDNAATDARKTPTDAATRVVRKGTSDFTEKETKHFPAIDYQLQNTPQT